MKKIYASDYRKMAQEKTSPQVGALLLTSLVFELLTDFVYGLIALFNNMASRQGMSWLSAIVTILALVDFALLCGFTFSWIVIARKLYRGEKVSVDDIFKGFNKEYWNRLLTYLVYTIYIALWSLLFFIPGVVKAHSYAMTMYIKEEHPEYDPNRAITESRRIMDGHKWEFFCLNLSYIGWHILAIFTLGILELWVLPRQIEADYIFYLHISERDQQPAIEAKTEAKEAESK